MSKKPNKPKPWRDFIADANPRVKIFLLLEYPFEWIVYFLKRWAFVEFLEIAGRFALLVTVLSWWFARDEIRDRENIGWWQIISSTEGRRVSGARNRALEELAARKVSLKDLNLAGAVLDHVKLPRASLERADLRLAQITDSDFASTVFEYAVATRVNIVRTNLSGARLGFAVLDSTYFVSTDLSGAGFRFANLRHASFFGGSLNGASFWGADLRHAVFSGLSLSGAIFDSSDLRFADLSSSSDWRLIQSLRSANLAGAALPPGFEIWARDSMGAVFISDSAQWDAIQRRNGGKLDY
jgi:uncharacterized protein YjbI with pentapeptide repeats